MICVVARGVPVAAGRPSDDDDGPHSVGATDLVLRVVEDVGRN
ncbi:MAG: hypothetical protein OEZ06_22840 [Myxococcales bacterium]|nr:hypothetical protein [Myxococcales bacterium]